MINKKTLILLVGETGVGKDTVANKLPYHKIISYTTRPMRNDEIDGINHIFITNWYMDEIEHEDNVIAWTQTGDIRYCATANQLKEDVNIYIINPDGVRYFKEKYKGPELNVIVIGLYLPLEIRRSRCKVRSDFNTSFEKRVSAEQQDFELFRLNGEFDYMIRNEDSIKTASIILYIIEQEKLNIE